MKYKRIPIDILDKPDEELVNFYEGIKWRNFAQYVTEFNGHIFVSEKYMADEYGNLRTQLHKRLIIQSSEYRERNNVPHRLNNVSQEEFNRYQ